MVNLNHEAVDVAGGIFTTGELGKGGAGEVRGGFGVVVVGRNSGLVDSGGRQINLRLFFSFP